MIYAVAILAQVIAGLLSNPVGAMAALWNMKCVSFAGLKGTWKIKRDETRTVDDRVFACIDALNFSLRGLVTEDNKNFADVDKTFRLTSASTYKQLLDIRNKAQSDALTVDAPVCSLFSESEVVPAKKRKRTRPADSAHGDASDKQFIQISVNIDGADVAICVLRPTTAREKVYVEYDEHNITAVVNFLRSGAVVDATYKQRDETLPTNIWNRGDHLMVMIKRGDTTLYKKAKTIEEAMERLNDNGCDDSLEHSADVTT